MKTLRFTTIFLGAFISTAGYTADACLSKEEAQKKYPGAALIATRGVEEIGKVGGLKMGFYVEDGTLVVDPDLGGPAHIAGIRRNDVVVAINGKPISSFESDQAIVGALRGKPNTTVALSVKRDGKVSVFKIVRKLTNGVNIRYCWGPNGKYM